MTNEEKSNKKDYEDAYFINSKLEEVFNNGIVLLKPMDSKRRKEIHSIVKNIPNVIAFSIGRDDKRRIVLRYKPYKKELVNVKELVKTGSEAYEKGDYDTCISTYRQLIEFGNPKACIYAKLGLAYMRKLDIEMAKTYLTVATELNKIEKGTFDFTELIDDLNGLVSEEDKKAYVKMGINDFKNKVDEYYGIKEIKQIAEFISSGKTIEDACLQVGLNEDQKNIVALIFAREYYAYENYTMGDYYLKKVEKAKNKSKFTNSLLEEVRKNKRFYKNRVEEEQHRLILKQNK